MDSREIQKQFRAAAWGNQQQIDAFVLACDALPAAEVLKLLAIFAEKGMATEGLALRNRLIVFKRLVEVAPDTQFFGPFVKALRTAESGLRTILVDLLPKVNSVPGHPDLAALVRLPDVAVRRSATQVMKQIGGKSFFDLAFALAREEHPGRSDAIDLVAQIGGYHAIPVLELCVVSAKGPERILALKLLGDTRLMQKDIPAALNAIIRGLGDATDLISTQAISSFCNLCQEDDYHARLAPFHERGSVAQVRAVVEGAKRFPSPRTFGLLERRFRMGPNSIRQAVLSALDVIGTDDALPLLAEALASKNVQIRTRAGEILSNLSINKKVNLGRTLLWLLRSRDPNVRRMAVDVARKVGDPSGELWPSLLRFLRDEDWWVRERVMDALVEMAGPALTKHIVSYLQDPSDVIRRYAVDVLIRVKDPAALGALVRSAMSDSDWWVRERAIEAVALLKDQRAVPYLLDLLAKVPELRVASITALATMNGTAAAEAVAAYLADSDVDVRLSAITCLGTIGGPALAPKAQEATSDVDYRVRNRAKEVLTQWNLANAQSDAQVITKAMTSLDRLLLTLANIEGDDLILAAGRRPYVKRLGKVLPIEGSSPIEQAAMRETLWPHLNDAQKASVDDMKDIDFSHEVKTEGLRFRANVFTQNCGLSAVFRIIKDELHSIEKLGLPSIVQTFGDMKNGLVLVGGPTGSGKSTTLAAIIDYINRTSSRHIISLEDPIEVMHHGKQSLVNQREVGTHTRSFSHALRSVLREDPDVILVGEMRDLATISFAVTAAETGHLVFGTLHTVSADTTMDRLINAFPGGQQAQVRSMLAESLRAVVCQHLLRRANGPGRVLSVEVMTNNDAISNLIRKGKCFQIPSIIATQREAGMQLMDGELQRLLKEGTISIDEAYMKANSKKEFEDLLEAAKNAAFNAPVAPLPSPVTTGSVSSPAAPPTIKPPSGSPQSFSAIPLRNAAATAAPTGPLTQPPPPKPADSAAATRPVAPLPSRSQPAPAGPQSRPLANTVPLRPPPGPPPGPSPSKPQLPPLAPRAPGVNPAARTEPTQPPVMPAGTRPPR